jgi:hypothetical protein
VTVLVVQRSLLTQTVILLGVLSFHTPLLLHPVLHTGAVQPQRGGTLLGARLVAVQNVQAGARLRIPHPAKHTPHTNTPQPPIVLPWSRTPVLIMTGRMRCCTQERCKLIPHHTRSSVT